MTKSKKNIVQKFFIATLTGATILSSAVPALADNYVVSGYAVISEDAGITEVGIEGEFNTVDLFRNIQNGTLRGTWSHGNTGFLGLGNIFSSVTGSSQLDNSRAQGRGTVRNGNGHEHTGGWQAPGLNSRGEISRTVNGTNLSFWDLRTP